jgi:hypothetical protein
MALRQIQFMICLVTFTADGHWPQCGGWQMRLGIASAVDGLNFRSFQFDARAPSD